MKSCPKCGYENNRESALMCGLCGGVFPEAAEKANPKRLFRYRRDFAKEITDNRLGSLALLIGFPILIIMLGLAFDLWFGVSGWGVIAAIAISIVLILFSYFEADHAILGMSGAHEADPQTDQQLINVVDEMRIAAGLPMPKVYIIESDAANAFATGRDPAHATVAVTRGLMNILNREELQGVIGHEMSHVRNFDIRYMMLVAAMVGTVVLLADGMRYGGRFGSFSRRGSRSGSAGGIMGGFSNPLINLAPFFLMLLQMAISPKRGFFARA